MKRQRSLSDPNGRHIRVYLTLINSPAWRVLGPSAVKLYLDMRAALTGTNNGNLSAALSDLKHRGWASSATLAKALFELRTLGFIAVTREGGLKMGTRVCTLYRFVDQPVFEQPAVGVLAAPATHDYRLFGSVKEAEQALATALGRLREEGGNKVTSKIKSPVQKLKRNASESEAERRSIASVSEH
ncbi:hypothetical protein PSP20601_03773 [Pandoraea sputorum]|nr:hypothetical protein PSP20601_03773 [Pandoraea sputorum]